MTSRPAGLAKFLGNILCLLALATTLNACANESRPLSKTKPLAKTEPLAKAEPLAAKLELRDSQDGFAGTTGILYSIEADGRFTLAHFVNEKIQPPARRGSLDPAALKALASVLEAQRLRELPVQIGEPPAVNPRRLVIQHGNTRTTLLLQAGADIATTLNAHEKTRESPTYRFLIVAQTILRVVGPDS